MHELNYSQRINTLLIHALSSPKLLNVNSNKKMEKFYRKNLIIRQ
jgi:hypothetical protein